MNDTIPLNERYAPSPSARVRLGGPAGEAVEHGPAGEALLLEHRERLVPRLAGVDHERAIEPPGEADLGPERGVLRVGRRVAVVEVEPGLPDTDDLGTRRERLERVPLVVEARRVVRVQADRGADVGMAGGELDGFARRREVGADAHHPDDAGVTGALRTRRPAASVAICG